MESLISFKDGVNSDGAGASGAKPKCLRRDLTHEATQGRSKYQWHCMDSSSFKGVEGYWESQVSSGLDQTKSVSVSKIQHLEN